MLPQFIMREQFYHSGTKHAVDIVFLNYEPYFQPEQLTDIMLMTHQEKLAIVLSSSHVIQVDYRNFLTQLGAYEIITACKRSVATELRDWLGQILYRAWQEYQLHLQGKKGNNKI